MESKNEISELSSFAARANYRKRKTQSGLLSAMERKPIMRFVKKIKSEQKCNKSDVCDTGEVREEIRERAKAQMVGFLNVSARYLGVA